jgi:hypothetical protein
VHPELTKEFWNEVLSSFERDDERLPPSEAAKQWRDSHCECDVLKEKCYLKTVRKLQEEYEDECESMRLEALEQAK